MNKYIFELAVYFFLGIVVTVSFICKLIYNFIDKGRGQKIKAPKLVARKIIYSFILCISILMDIGGIPYFLDIPNAIANNYVSKEGIIKRIEYPHNKDSSDYYLIMDNAKYETGKPSEDVEEGDLATIQYMPHSKVISSIKLFSGRAVQKYKDITYYGYWKDGKYSGMGTMIYKSGEIYRGKWGKGEFISGSCTIKEKYFGIYIGEYSNERKNGQGVYIYDYGDKYIGDWKDGLESGRGTYFDKNGGKRVGIWKDGVFEEGSGTRIYDNGDKYIGQWKKNNYEGKGTFIYKNLGKYIGEFKNGVEDGKGTYIYKDGSRYIGNFKKDMFNGQGVLYGADGKETYNGLWKDCKSVKNEK